MELYPVPLDQLIMIVVDVTIFLVVLYITGVGKQISQLWFSFFMNAVSPLYNAAVAQHKQQLFAQLQQHNTEGKEMTVLEIGCGPGGSLHMYPKDVPIKLIAVEPNIYHRKYLEHNLTKYDNITLQDFIVCKAEHMESIESNSLETVISTIVLCSVDDQADVVREIKRVLKPGGRFYFMEHVEGEPGTWLCWFQHLFNRPWSVICDGCNIVRDTASVIQGAGFAEVHIERFVADKLNYIFYFVYPHISGYAVKGGDETL